MPYITDIKADGELNTALANFAAVCTSEQETLGLVLDDVNEINAAAADFNTDYNAWTAKKAEAEAARETKDSQKADSRSVISKWAKTFRANSTISDALLEQLMVAPHAPVRNNTPPAQPLSLVANADGNGNVELRWNRNGNIQGTVFVIEYKTSAEGSWTQLGTSTKRRFATAWSPGTYVSYRVYAQRRGLNSIASTPVVLWDGVGGASFLQLAA